MTVPRMAARLLIVVAAILGLFAMHAVMPVSTLTRAAATGSLSAASPAARSATALVSTISSDDEPAGACCATACGRMSAACLAAPNSETSVTPGLDTATGIEHVDSWKPTTIRRAGAQTSSWLPIGLTIAALAVLRI